MELRTGHGTDIHRLAAGRRLVLGGVPIEHDHGPVSHSDGDVLLHAVIDALLGAAGLGDIGERFPDTDPQWKDADSAAMLGEVVAAVLHNGWSLANLDCTVCAERPKVAPYKHQIRARLSEIVGVSPERINVKAKTGEQVGPVGRGEAIAAEAVVLLSRP